MGRPRLTIALAMGLVLFVAIGCAGLARPSRFWAAVLFSGATLALAVAVAGALFGLGRRRVLSAGFAIGCGFYLLLQYGPWFESQVGPYTLPTALIDFLYSAIRPEPSPAPSMPAGGGKMMMMGGMGGTSGMMGRMMGGYAGMMGGGSWMQAAPSPPSNPWAVWTAPDRGEPWPDVGTPHSFYRIAHSLLSLPAGLLGALLALRFSTRREDREGTP